MLTWKGIVQNYIVKYSDKIKKTTQPLRERFGVGYFTYHRVDAQGNYTVLVDRPEYAEHYVAEQLYKSDPFQGLPHMFQTGLNVIENHMSVAPIKSLLHIDTGVMLVQKGDTDVAFYGFMGNKKTSALSSLALNYPQLLYGFAEYFTQELGRELSLMRQEKTSLFHLHGTKKLPKAPNCQDIDDSTIYAYYKDLGMAKEVEMAQNLSNRERECLLLLLKGKSAKETARLLGITRRTVESYFEGIKAKLLCWNKQEVFDAAKRLQSLHLLPP